MRFKVKSTTHFQNMFATYCDRKGIALDSVRFRSCNDPRIPRISGTDTPALLGLEDDDVVDVMEEHMRAC